MPPPAGPPVQPVYTGSFETASLTQQPPADLSPADLYDEPTVLPGSLLQPGPIPPEPTAFASSALPAPAVAGPSGGLATQEIGVADLDVLDDEEVAVEKRRREVPELPYLAGLDGLRGVALLAVLAFAGGISQVRGGFLGISTALTLSGFLLTTNALTEWGKQGRLSLLELWQRRAQRIVPACYFVIACVIVLQVTARVGSVPSFRTDVWAALGFVTNWQLAYPGEGFSRIFQDLSALQHLWPVAIAVQLTILVPVVFAAVMAVTSRTWRTAAAVFAAAGLASFVAAWVISGQPEGHDVVYYGTHTRAGELLVGVVLAYLVMTPRFRSIIRKPRVLMLVRGGGLPALALLLLMWTLIRVDSGFLFKGGTMLNAVLTGWLVLAVTMPGPTSGLLGQWPLRKLGEISFCAYVVHWPLFLLIDEDRTPLDGAPLFGVRAVTTIAAAVAVSWVVEATFRWRLKLPAFQLAAGLAATAAILAVLVVILPENPPANISLTVDDGSDQPGQLDVVTPDGGEEQARILLVGDETAASMVPGFASWNEANPAAQVRVDTHVAAGCPLGGPWNTRRFGEAVEPSIECVAWPFRLPETLDAADYDVVVVSMGAADLGEREVQRDWGHLGDPAFDQWMGSQIEGLGDHLTGPEAPVLWLTTPHVRMAPAEASSQGGPAGWADYDDNDPQRVNRLNAILQGTIGSKPEFEVVDFDAWLQNQSRGEFNPAIRVGAELTEEGAGAAANWLVPRVLETVGVAPESADAGADADPGE